MLFLGLAISSIGLGATIASIYFSKYDQFYSDTHFLIPVGIFIWGDGLILGPFLVLSGFIFTQLSLLQAVQYSLLFWAVRSGYEVVYWITHQAAGKKYQPPLFRKVSWLDAGKSAILYQLITTLGLFLSLFGLLYSFSF